VSVTVTGPAGLQENSTATLKSNEAPACTVVGPVLIAAKQFCGVKRRGQSTARWSSEWEVIGGDASSYKSNIGISINNCSTLPQERDEPMLGTGSNMSLLLLLLVLQHNIQHTNTVTEPSSISPLAAHTQRTRLLS
jgi:hypothetical protein